jgi:hypothetical protein
MKIFISITIAAIFFMGCETQVKNFQLEEKPSQIVINANLNADSLAKIHLSKSLGILDRDTIEFISDAYVELIENNNTTYPLYYIGNGNYQTESLIPKVGNTYEIKASAEGFEDASAIGTIPAPPSVLSMRTALYKDTAKNGYNDAILVNMKFKDDAGTEDYYMIESMAWKLIAFDTNMVVDFVPLTMDPDERIVEIAGNTEIFNDFELYKPDYKPGGKAFFFSDSKINGQEIKCLFSIETSGITNVGPEVIIYFHKISKEHYLFISSLAKAYGIENNPIAERVSIYNNITNGLGHMYCRSTYAYRMDISGIEDFFLDPWWLGQ